VTTPGGTGTTYQFYIHVGDPASPPSLIFSTMQDALNGATPTDPTHVALLGSTVGLLAVKTATPPANAESSSAPAESSGLGIMLFVYIGAGVGGLILIGAIVGCLIWKFGSDDDLLAYAETGNDLYNQTEVETLSMSDIQSSRMNQAGGQEESAGGLAY
jgi:hypothetical protein